MKKITTKLRFRHAAVCCAMQLALPCLAAPTAPEDELEHIVITASRTESSVAKAPASISLLELSDIVKQPVKDLVDVLQTLPGVTNRPTSGGRNSIMIRGLDEDYVLRLVDGKRVSSSNGIWRANNFDNTAIPLQFIDRVEVIRGPMSALYGSDAVGGVVNIITKQPSADWQTHVGFEKSVMQQGDGGDRHKTALVSRGQLNNALGLTLSAEHAKQQAWYYQPISDSADHTIIEPRQSSKLASTLDWQLAANHQLSLDLAHDKDEVPLASYGYAQYQQSIRRWTYGLTEQSEWSWGSTELLVNRSNADMTDFNSRYVDVKTTSRDERYLTPREIFTTARATANLDIGSHALTSGAEYLKTEVKDDIQYPKSGGASLDLTSLFLQDQFDIRDDLAATLGVRAEDAQLYGSHVSPRGYLVYSLNDDITIKGGVGTAFRAPTLFQASPLFQSISCGGKCFIYGNPNLREETSVNHELALLVKQPQWHASISWFHNQVKNLMEVGFYPAGHVNAGNRGYFNIDQAVLQGAELTFWWRLNELVSLDSNYSYLDAVDGDQHRLEGRPRHKAYAQLNVDLSDRLAFYISHTYYGAQLDTAVADKQQDSYSISDVGARYSLPAGIALKAGLTNAFASQPRTHDATSSLYLQGRALFAGVEYSF